MYRSELRWCPGSPTDLLAEDLARLRGEGAALGSQGDRERRRAQHIWAVHEMEVQMRARAEP